VVEVYEALFAVDLASELSARLQDLQPVVVGISIRLVHGDVVDTDAPLGTRHIDLRPRVRDLVQVVRQHSAAPIVLGGPGFNYYARVWLEYLGLDYGIQGEGEEAFPRFLECLAQGADICTVPGCVYRRGGTWRAVPPRPVEDLNGAPLPAYDLFDLAQYAERNISPAIFTKRGCAYSCTYCPASADNATASSLGA
jgi:radical SAM superfamily enzyme YgiQ (UPF0313 family)